MDIINNNPNIEDTPKEKKVWCTFQNHDHCITINESTVLKCWNTLKKKYSSFNLKTIDCVDVVARNFNFKAGRNDHEYLALDLETFKNGFKSLKGVQ